MPRVKRGVTARARHKKVLDQAKGFRGRRSSVYRIAKEAVMKALGRGWGAKVRWLDIEVARARSGKPDIVLHDKAAFTKIAEQAKASLA